MRHRSTSVGHHKTYTYRPAHRRTCSNFDSLAHIRPQLDFRKTVFTSIKGRLMENGDNVGWMSADIINFCLPDRETANQFLWVRLLFQPLSISDEELCKMFQ